MSTIVNRELEKNLLSHLILNSPEFKQLYGEVCAGHSVISISGLVSLPARALAVAMLLSISNRSLCVIVANNNSLEQWERDLQFWQVALSIDTAGQVLSLPASESDIYAGTSPHIETLEKRALTLWSLATRKSPGVVLTTARGVVMRTVTPAELLMSGAILTRDAEFNPEELIERLISSGFIREEPVTTVGEFSVRGGIVDVWSPGASAPVRIEFFGDVIDSIRTFDAETQLSTGQIESTEIVPMREYSVSSADFRRWAESARLHFGDERFTRALRDRTIFADHGESFPGWEWLIPLTLGKRACALEFLDNPVLIIDEPGEVEHQLETLYAFSAKRYGETISADELALSPDTHYLSPDELRTKLDLQQRIELRALGRDAARTDSEFVGEVTESSLMIGQQKQISAPLFLFPAVEQGPEIEWISHTSLRYHGRIANLCEDLKRSRSRLIHFAMPSTGVAERIREMLGEYNINAAHDLLDASTVETDAGKLHVVVTGFGSLSSGFELPKCGLVVHVEGDLFDEAGEKSIEHRAAHRSAGTALSPSLSPSVAPSRKVRTSAFLSDFRDLKSGDYVVHVDHGIARFGGLQTLDLTSKNGQRTEFMLLYYAEDARLYVPVERLDLVQRYASSEAHLPQLDRLGGLGWQKTKARAKRAMRDMADELLRLYAERKLVSGHVFPSDTPWQAEFEEAFEYTLTSDQVT
ncbi:MAG: CarD family transcriptional regulator, partial [Pyrinomonadaceae bacterium]